MINLLPQSKKDEIKLMIKKRAISVFLMSLGVLFFIFSALIAPSVLLLDAKEKSLKDILSRSEEERQKVLIETEAEIKKYNQRSSLYLKNKDVVSIPDIYFDEAIKAKPTNISLNNFSFSRSETERILDVSGIAENREALLGYVESLKLISNIEDVTVPISSFVKGENLEFTVRIIYEK